MFAWAKILIGSMTLCQILEATLFNSARNSGLGLLFLDDGVRLSWFGGLCLAAGLWMSGGAESIAGGLHVLRCLCFEAVMN